MNRKEHKRNPKPTTDMIHQPIAFLCMLLPCKRCAATPTEPVQDGPHRVPAAGSSPSLMRYVDYPVSHLTGVYPVIRDPAAYGADRKDILASHAHVRTPRLYSRPNRRAGSVGKGWSLEHRAAAVTRQVNGLDDLNPSTLTPGYYYASDIPTDYREGDAVQRSELNARRTLLREAGRGARPLFLLPPARQKAARSYFQASRPDGSVEAVPVPYDGVKIEYGSDRRFTSQGHRQSTKYVFSLAATDTEQPISGGMDDNIVIAWKCESSMRPSPRGTGGTASTYTDDYPRFVTTYNDRIVRFTTERRVW